MKRALFLAGLLLCQFLYAQDTWTRISPQPTIDAANDIHFISENIGFIITNGELLKTSDSGETWQITTSEVKGTRIAFLNSVGFVVGGSGRVYRTTDSGDTWEALPQLSDRNMVSISMIDANNVVVTNHNTVFFSQDGGDSWSSSSPGNVTITDSFFTSPMTGHLACYNGTIMKTTDGGETWYETISSTQIPSHFTNIFFVSDEVGFASRERDDFFKTTDAGETWTNVLPDLAIIMDLQFLSELIGYFVDGNGRVFKTSDGGESWENVNSQGIAAATSLGSVHFVNESLGFVSGLQGRISKTTDGGETWNAHWPLHRDLDDLELQTNNHIYAISRGRSLVKSTDNGLTFDFLAWPSNNEKLSDLHFLTPNLGFAVAGGSIFTSEDSDKVFKTSDGGLNWMPTNGGSFIDPDLKKVLFIDEENGFTSGRNGVYKTNNGGDTWERVFSTEIRQFQFINSSIGFGRTKLNQLYKTTDGGDTWLPIITPPKDMLSFHFYDENNGFIIGEQQLIQKTQDGGGNWEEIVIENGDYKDVKMYSPSTIYALKENGVLLKSNNGGSDWEWVYHSYANENIILVDGEIYLYGIDGHLVKSTTPNEPPIIEGANVLSTLEDTPFEISISDLNIIDYDSDFPADFTLELEEGDDYTVDGANVIPASNFNGNLVINIRVNDGFNSSPPFELSLEVTPVNDQPEITGVIDPFFTTVDTALELDISNLTVLDPDNDFPSDFSLEVLEGDNYSVTGTTLSPTVGFLGTLTVPVIVNDGQLDSDPFNLSLEVMSITSIENDQFLRDLKVFPNPSTQRVTISFNSTLYTPVRLSITNLRGQTFRSEIITKTEQNFTHTLESLNLQPGIYFISIEVEGKRKTVKKLVLKD